MKYLTLFLIGFLAINSTMTAQNDLSVPEIDSQTIKVLKKGTVEEMFNNLNALREQKNFDKSAVAMTSLALFYSLGMGTIKDETEAHKLHKMAMKTGDPGAIYGYAMDLYDGLGVKEDKPEALKQLKIAAEKDHLESSFQLGYHYYKLYNYDTAIPYLRKAALGNHARALNVLAFCFENGWGVSKDPFEAFKLYKKAVEKGELLRGTYNLFRCYSTGIGTEINEKEAMVWLLKAVEKQNSGALFDLGVAYKYGRYGLEKDVNKAKEYLLKAKNKGNEKADDELAPLEGRKTQAEIKAEVDAKREKEAEERREKEAAANRYNNSNNNNYNNSSYGSSAPAQQTVTLDGLAEEYLSQYDSWKIETNGRASAGNTYTVTTNGRMSFIYIVPMNVTASSSPWLKVTAKNMIRGKSNLEWRSDYGDITERGRFSVIKFSINTTGASYLDPMEIYCPYNGYLIVTK